MKKVKDFITDGILSYGVSIGRFIFEKENITVYAITDLMHIGNSDAYMIYQITKQDYEKLLPRSKKNEIPILEVSKEETDKVHCEFLCGESVYCKRNSFSLKNIKK